MVDGLVWYAAYGSNLSFERFMAYVQGGSAPGNSRRHPGSSDRTAPREDRPFELPGYRLCFGGEAPQWGGSGVAFLMPETGESVRAFCRIYKISTRQFLDLVAQENGLSPTKVEARLAEEHLATGQAGDESVLPLCTYGRVVCVGRAPDAEGNVSPIWTFTSSGKLAPAPRAPGMSYVSHLVQGLREAYARLGDEALSAALLALRESLARLITNPGALDSAVFGGPTEGARSSDEIPD